MAISVDLSSLANWGNVSSGSHTLTIVAKATGYRDSNPSAGVNFTKAPAYSINASIQHASLSGDTSIIAGGTATVTIVPNQGYGFPSTLISVTNAQYSYDNTTGVIILSNATGTVLILGECPVSGYTVTTASGFNPNSAWDGNSYVHLVVNGTDTYDLTTAVASATIATGVSTIKFDSEAGAGPSLDYTMGGSSGTLLNLETLTLTGDLIITGFDALCLTGDTLVTLADGSTKRLDKVEVGDYVLSYDWNTMEKMARKVILIDKDAHKTHTEYDVWTFDNGSVVKTVHRHEFYNAEAKRFKYMDEWQIGEHTLAIDGTLTALVSHEVVKEEVEHFKITLDTSTNYFANGLLTGDRYCPKDISFEGAI